MALFDPWVNKRTLKKPNAKLKWYPGRYRRKQSVGRIVKYIVFCSALKAPLTESICHSPAAHTCKEKSDLFTSMSFLYENDWSFDFTWAGKKYNWLNHPNNFDEGSWRLIAFTCTKIGRQPRFKKYFYGFGKINSCSILTCTFLELIATRLCPSKVMYSNKRETKKKIIIKKTHQYCASPTDLFHSVFTLNGNRNLQTKYIKSLQFTMSAISNDNWDFLISVINLESSR